MTRRPVVRWDLAWALFLPDCASGSLPTDFEARRLAVVGRWFREHMGTIAGRRRLDSPDTVWLACSALTDTAREDVTRMASFWCDGVYWEEPSATAPNRWLAPMIDVDHVEEEPLAAALAASYAQGREHPLIGISGVRRIHATVQVVAVGFSSARWHSHTRQDEHYLILKHVFRTSTRPA